MRPSDFPASTHQPYAVSRLTQQYIDPSKLVSDPIEGEIRLAGTRHSYKVLIAIYEMPPHAIGFDIWAPSDMARLRISQHRDLWGRINVTLGGLQFDAALGSFAEVGAQGDSGN